MDRQPDKTIVFETKAEFDAFMKGFLWTREEYEADIVTGLLNRKYQVELQRIHEEDYQPGGKYCVEQRVATPYDISVSA